MVTKVDLKKKSVIIASEYFSTLANNKLFKKTDYLKCIVVTIKI